MVFNKNEGDGVQKGRGGTQKGAVTWRPGASSGGCGGREGGSNTELPTQGQGHGTCAVRVESQSHKIIRVRPNDLRGLFQPSPSRQCYLKGFGFPVGTPRRPLQISPFSPEVYGISPQFLEGNYSALQKLSLNSSPQTQPHIQTGTQHH